MSTMKHAAAMTVALSLGLNAGAGVLSVHVVTKEGAVPPGGGGSLVSTLNAPFTDAAGRVGFTGNLNPSNNFIWYNAGIIWRNSDGLPDVLTGAEGTMGVSNTGDFIYSPSTNGNDSVWTAAGVLLQGTDVAPAYPAQFNTFNSRPTMLADGTAYWMAGLANVSGGASVNRVFYKRAPGGPITKVFAGGDIVDGFTLNMTASNFDYCVSDNGMHHIHLVQTTDATTVNDFVYVNGSMVHREGSPNGDGANWAVFDAPSINNAGNYVFAGDDSGATATDGFMAYNGTILIREGDTIDGVLSASGWATRAMSINNHNRVVFIWGTGTNEHLFEGNASDLDISAKRILSTNEDVDTNNDGIVDATVIDMFASVAIGPGLDFSTQRFIHLEVDLRDIATQVVTESIIRVPLPDIADPCPPDLAPFAGDGVINTVDLLALINQWGPCPGCSADLTGDDVVSTPDLLALINAWGPCQFP